MFRKMYQGGSSRKQGPRLAMRDADEKPRRDAPVRPCEWPSECKWLLLYFFVHDNCLLFML